MVGHSLRINCADQYQMLDWVGHVNVLEMNAVRIRQPVRVGWRLVKWALRRTSPQTTNPERLYSQSVLSQSFILLSYDAVMPALTPKSRHVDPQSRRSLLQS